MVTEEKDGKKVTKEKEVFDPYRLKISLDTTQFSPYENGGMVTQVNIDGGFTCSVLPPPLLFFFFLNVYFVCV